MNKITKNGFDIMGEIILYFLDWIYEEFFKHEGNKSSLAKQFVNILLLIETFQLADGEATLLE